MQLLDLTLDDPAANIALDEALLEAAEASHEPREVLRLWEPTAPMVVLGRSSHVAHEVHEEACRERGIPIFRRASGGLSIVTGPGCLMYAVVLSLELRPALRSIDEAHREVSATLLKGLSRLVPGVARQGTSDLVIRDNAMAGGRPTDTAGPASSGTPDENSSSAGISRKFSGNSLRCKRRHVLYHGTLLYDFPLELIGQCLAEPPRAPDYRAGRTHAGFVANLPVRRSELTATIVEAWQANDTLTDWPQTLVAQLVADKYSRDDWNFQH